MTEDPQGKPAVSGVIDSLLYSGAGLIFLGKLALVSYSLSRFWFKPLGSQTQLSYQTQKDIIIDYWKKFRIFIARMCSQLSLHPRLTFFLKELTFLILFFSFLRGDFCYFVSGKRWLWFFLLINLYYHCHFSLVHIWMPTYLVGNNCSDDIRLFQRLPALSPSGW